MKKVSIGNIFAVVIPIVVALIVGFMWMGQDKRRRELVVKEASLQTKNSSLKSLLTQLDVELVANKTIADTATAEEQAEFLTQLRLKAQNAKVRLARYTNRGVITPRTDPKKPDEVRQLFRPVASSVEVEGDYLGVRQFAYSLIRDQRLMNMSGVAWRRNPSDRNTTLAFTLIRYVTDPATSQPSPQVASTPIGEALQ